MLWGKDFEAVVLQSDLDSSSSSDDATNASTSTSSSISSPKLTVTFKDGTVVKDVDVLVGADGVRSEVMKGVAGVYSLASSSSERAGGSSPSPSVAPLPSASGAYFGIMLILGISPFQHPLLHERGFYTLSGDARLFTMPFAGGSLDSPDSDSDSDSAPSSPRLTMWQLSYNLPSLDAALLLRRAGPEALLSEALRVSLGWHDPVSSLISASPLDTVWGSPLYDRFPTPLNGGGGNGGGGGGVVVGGGADGGGGRVLGGGSVPKKRGGGGGGASLEPSKLFGGRLVCLGDAAHAMSPFKGQGANQALLDGPLLAEWLCEKKCKDVATAIKCFEREMVQRTGKKVRDSREAAKIYHSMEGVEGGEEGFAGVPKTDVKRLLAELKARDIKARAGGDLDSEVLLVINDLGITLESDKDKKTVGDAASIRLQLLQMAADGDMAGLRSLSHTASADLAATDDGGRSLAHIAAEAKHLYIVKWLVKEAQVDWMRRDKSGKTARDYAGDGEEGRRIVRFLNKMEEERRKEELKAAQRKDRERVVEKERQRRGADEEDEEKCLSTNNPEGSS